MITGKDQERQQPALPGTKKDVMRYLKEEEKEKCTIV
jgi:hypothetical protein